MVNSVIPESQNQHGSDQWRGRSPGPYVPGTSWDNWYALFSNNILLREITDEGKKKLMFLTEIGQANYSLLVSLLEGRRPEDEALKTLADELRNYHQGKRLLLAERFRLMKSSQREGQ